MPSQLTYFEQTTTNNSGSLSGDFVWSDPTNWPDNPPADGDTVNSVGMTGYDDVGALTLAGLSLGYEGEVSVVGGALGIGGVDSEGGTLVADALDAGADVQVTVGTITGGGGTFLATGFGATLFDQSADDPGNTYGVSDFGVIEFTAPPTSRSTLDFLGIGAFDFATLTPTDGMAITGLVAGDVIEVPGSSVSDFDFGVTSLTITTDLGVYSFTNVSYSPTVVDYDATVDAATGLVAITFLGPDSLSLASPLISGPFFGDAAWSNAANWSDGVPDGRAASVANVQSVDDLDELTLTSISLSGGLVNVVGASLDVDNITGDGGLLVANEVNAGAPVSVTIGTIEGREGQYSAEGVGADLIDNSSIDQGSTFYVQLGGEVELAEAPASTTSLNYDLTADSGTFALDEAQAANAVTLTNVAQGDVLELPGSSVSKIMVDANSLTITTDQGDDAFTNVSYLTPISSYTWKQDTATGLVAITFVAPDILTDTTPLASGPFFGDAAWSTAANWSDGVPVDGGAVSAAGVQSVDDLAGLTLSSLGLSGGLLNVVGASLGINSLTGDGDVLVANDANAGAPVSVTLGTIDGREGQYSAVGAGAKLIDNSSIDQGNSYYVQLGGEVELVDAPADTTSLNYDFIADSGTFALDDAQATNAVALTDIAPGDVLELPGSSVSNVAFGANSLTVTTDLGTDTFTNVSYLTTIGSYTATQDAATDLVAISFVAPVIVVPPVTTVFQDTHPATGNGLWSDPTNWGPGVPTTGEDVYLPISGTDDLTTLSIATLTLVSNALYVTGNSLTVADVISVQGEIIALPSSATAPVTVTVASIDGTGGYYDADGAGATFIDQSATDPGENYYALFGGVVEMAATPAATSELGYGGVGSTFAIESPAASNSLEIFGMGRGDVLELPGTSISAVVFGPHSLSVTTNLGTDVFSDVNYVLEPTSYTTGFDTTTGLVEMIIACYQRGTAIATPSGEVLIEHLAIGDLVQTVSGPARAITWIGHRRIDCARHPKPQRIWPVRVRAGGFGSGVPHRDLMLSPDHSVFIDDVLIPIKELINGISIVQERCEQVTYHHVELAHHDVILAEGLPSESFLDAGNRSGFSSGGTVTALHPEFAASSWDMACAPLLMHGPMLAAIQARLVGRATEVGYTEARRHGQA